METASAVSGWLWRRLAPLNKRHPRALAHLRMAMPEKSEAERQAILREMWENLGRTFAEFFHLDELLAGGRVTFHDADLWRARFPTSKTWIAGGGHFGNFEVAAGGFLLVGQQASDIYRKINNPFVDAFVLRMRAPSYPGGLIAKGPTAGRRQIRRAHEGGLIIAIADLRDSSSFRVPFFGKEAPTTRFPAVLARKIGVPLIATRVVRDPGVRFRVVVEQVEVPKTADINADVLVATTRLQAVFERWIREYPSQWMWAHRRWG